jgi:hypothetical protein
MMCKSLLKLTVVAAGGIVLLGSLQVLPANAADSDAQQAEAALNAIAELPDTLVPDATDSVKIDSDGDLVASESGGTVVIPEDASDGVSIATSNGVKVDVGLPGASKADDAVVKDGLAVYTDALPSATVAAKPVEEGGLQAFSIIEGNNAPSEYAYPITSDSPVKLELNSDGSVSLLDQNHSFLGLIGTPWAKDAEGISVPTRFRVEGNSLIQVVEHKLGTYSYPITADPCMFGKCLSKTAIKVALCCGHNYSRCSKSY